MRPQQRKQARFLSKRIFGYRINWNIEIDAMTSFFNFTAS
jgi:hypothetical protein